MADRGVSGSASTIRSAAIPLDLLRNQRRPTTYSGRRLASASACVGLCSGELRVWRRHLWSVKRGARGRGGAAMTALRNPGLTWHSWKARTSLDQVIHRMPGGKETF